MRINILIFHFNCLTLQAVKSYLIFIYHDQTEKVFTYRKGHANSMV